jgi:protein SCO1/2
MKRFALFLAAACVLAVPLARAHHDDVSAAHPEQGIAFEQHLDAPLPGGLRFVDEAGRRVTLASELGKPVVLVLGYLACRDLCPLTLEGTAQALDQGGLTPGTDYRALFVSIDPRATPATLLTARNTRLAAHDRGAWTFLAGDAKSIDALASAVGFRYRYDAAHDDYAHPAGFVVATPDGRIARYFFGVRYDSGAVAGALRDAAGGAPGRPASPLLLLCYHYDRLTGRYTLTVLGVLRALGVAFLLAAGVWAWRLRRARRRE